MVEYFSFEEVMAELELSEEDLKRMVSEGELRAFRDENKMKFKKEDVEHLKKGRITEPTIILPSTPGATQDDTVLDLDVNTESPNLEVSQSRGRGPSDEDLLVPSEAQSGGGAADEEDAGLTTEPLKLADEVETAETVETEPVTEEAVPSRRRSSTMQRSPRRAGGTGGSAAATEEDLERRRGSPLWTALTLVAFVFAAYAGIFAYDMLRFQTGATQPTAMTAGMAEFIMNQFWGDKGWVKHHQDRFPDGPNGKAVPPFTMPPNAAGNYEIKHRSYDKTSFMEAYQAPK
jgi:hypothetical protein